MTSCFPFISEKATRSAVGKTHNKPKITLPIVALVCNYTFLSEETATLHINELAKCFLFTHLFKRKNFY